MVDADFGIFPFKSLPERAKGFELNCGSGRWVLGRPSRPASTASTCPQKRWTSPADCSRAATMSIFTFPASIPLPDGSLYFGYSLEVLHHVLDTGSAMASCVAKLKPGASFLVYL
jgi:hypothetical protein